MATIRDLKVRIKAVGNIRQITRAMEMVATTKLRRFQDRALAARPFSKEIEGLVGSLADMLGESNEHPLFQNREGKKTAVLFVGSDRGLCGAYNANIFHCLRDWMAENEDRELHLFAIGKKAVGSLSRRDIHVDHVFEDPQLELMEYSDKAAIARYFVDAFLRGDFDEVKICYTGFQSLSRYEPQVAPFLPLSGIGDKEGGKTGRDLILEPSKEEIFEAVVPKYLEVRMSTALLEALTSEYASRMVSMKNATEAAGDMQKELGKVYNRLRQGRITKELLDIVGGAEAVSG